MQIDFRMTLPVLVMFVLMILLPFFNFFSPDFVRWIEHFQAMLLIFFACFTYFYMQPLQLEAGDKYFWLWAVCWWILLFGRSISWGRDYFPDVPRVYYRILSICFIAPILGFFFSADFRTELKRKIQAFVLPFWTFVLVVTSIIIADAIEHERVLSSLFIDGLTYQDLMEELYEFPIIIGLFLLAWSLMKKEKQRLLE